VPAQVPKVLIVACGPTLAKCKFVMNFSEKLLKTVVDSRSVVGGQCIVKRPRER